MPGKKSLLKEEDHFEVVLVDVTESTVERPEKKQKLNSSDRGKRHTQKTQIIADKSGKKILCTAFDRGRKHDFKLFKDKYDQGYKDISHYCRKVTEKVYCYKRLINYLILSPLPEFKDKEKRKEN